MARIKLLVNNYIFGHYFNDWGLLDHIVKKVEQPDSCHKLLTVDMTKKAYLTATKTYNLPIDLFRKRAKDYEIHKKKRK